MTGAPSNRATLREDLLVSFCLTDAETTPDSGDWVAMLVQQLGTKFRFFEVVVVAEENRADAYQSLMQQIPNLRLFLVHEGLAVYRKRVVAVSEAIGDVVLLTSPTDGTADELVAMIEIAADRGTVVTGQGDQPRASKILTGRALFALGYLAGFQAIAGSTATIALPRTLLNRMLDHAAPELALRFVPRDTRIPTMMQMLSRSDRQRGWEGAGRRVRLAYTLLTYIAPVILIVVSMASALLTLLGLFYSLYVVGIWAFKANIEPGWLTLSVVLSLTSTFLGASIFGLSIGMQHLLTLNRKGRGDEVAREMNRIDLYGQLAQELNVDLDAAWERTKT